MNAVRRLLSRLALYAFHVLVVRPLLRVAVGVRYRRRNLVPDGPCVVVSNHNSHLDAAVLMSLFPLRRLASVHPVAAADYFDTSWFLRTVSMLLMNAVPVERHPARGRGSLAQIVPRLRAGESLIFFPEGSRGDPGVVAPFRSGIGRLVQDVPGLLIVPVFLSGPERIWPRGRIVPVPLGIDCNVGRPRTYPDDGDPRAIAEHVRRDVLALAPPPAPQPGQRPFSPLRIAVCGSDRRARAELVRALTERLGRSGRALALGDSALEADAQGLRESLLEASAGAGRPRMAEFLVSRLGRRRELDGPRLTRLIERARIEAAARGRDTRFVVADGGALVELAAAVDRPELHGGDDRALHQVVQYLSGERRVPLARWWRVLRESPAVWWITVLGLARAPQPEVLVRLVQGQPSPAGAGGPPGLEEAYRRVAEVLRRRRVTVLEVDAARVDLQEAVRRIDGVCLDLARARAAPVRETGRGVVQGGAE